MNTKPPSFFSLPALDTKLTPESERDDEGKKRTAGNKEKKYKQREAFIVANKPLKALEQYNPPLYNRRWAERNGSAGNFSPRIFPVTLISACVFDGELFFQVLLRDHLRDKEGAHSSHGENDI